ncbi:MAG: helix-turn-helix transcriptional regulator [Oscillospiraceae bacterium]
MPNRIKELRKSHKMNQTQLGKIVGVSTSAIGMYEQGRRDPDTSTLLNIAKTFDVSMDYLVGVCDLPERFNIDSIAKSVAKNLMDQPALMFNADCYTSEELSELSLLIENSVRNALSDKLLRD